MIVYNLTDRTPPWEKTPRTSQGVKLFGKVIPAGGCLEFPNFPLRTVTGLINSHTISVDNVPGWYTKIGDERRKAESEKLEQIASLPNDGRPKKRLKRKSND